MDIEVLQKIPNSPWVYFFKDKKENILYIWKAKNLKSRVSQYFNANSVRKQDMLNKAESVDFLQVQTESEALYLEDNLIKKHQPPFNNMLKWSNSYAYIKITNEDFPQIFITRNKKKDGSIYIWPKHNTKNLKNFLQYLRYILKWRWCKKIEFNKWKLCSDYHFWLCQWRCSKSIFLDRELASQEYQQIIQKIIHFFKWNNKPIKNEIKAQIELAAKTEKFERAAKLRDIYLQIENLTEQQTVVLPKNSSGYFCVLQKISSWRVYIILNFYEWKIIDIIINKQNSDDIDLNSIQTLLELEFGKMEKDILEHQFLFFSPKIKLNKSHKTDILELSKWFLDSYLAWESLKDENLLNDLLLELQEKYKFKNFPYHIECIDISHFAGENTSGGLSWFLWWIANYKLYRKYKISQNNWDDYLSIQEVLIKRFQDKTDFPDLFIIDGGKWQLWVVKTLLSQKWFAKVFEKVDFISLWKWLARKNSAKLKWEKEKIFYFDSKKNIKSIDLSYDQSDQVLIKLRDEAHRFANTYRKQQEKRNTSF